jgi:hypothetical protein
MQPRLKREFLLLQGVSMAVCPRSMAKVTHEDRSTIEVLPFRIRDLPVVTDNGVSVMPNGQQNNLDVPPAINNNSGHPQGGGGRLRPYSTPLNTPCRTSMLILYELWAVTIGNVKQVRLA